jgi:putative inorganic carbon (hco3(-)) transporter
MAQPDRRSFSLPLCILAAVLVGLPWADGGRSPAGQAAVVLLLALAGAAVFLRRDTGPILKPSPLLAAGAILVGASAARTIYPDLTVQALLLVIAYVVAVALAVQAGRDAAWMERALLDAGVFSGLLVAALGFVWLSQGNDGGFYADALIGPFGYPNAMAAFLLLAGGASAATLQPDRHWIERAAALVTCAACLIGLHLTRSRGVWVAVAVGALCWAAVQWRREWSSRLAWVFLGALSIAAGLILANSREGSLVSLLSQGSPAAAADTSVQWRLSVLQWTCAMIRDHPWLGVGPGAFPVALLQYQRIPYVSGENPHNLYIEIASEYGLPVGILFSLGLAVVLARVATATRRMPIERHLRGRRAALLAVLAAFAVHSGMDLNWSFPAVAMSAAVILGLCIATLPPRAMRPRRHPSLWRTAVLVLLTASATLALTRYYSTTLVAWGRNALAVGDVATAERHLTRAGSFNPLSYPAHAWQARARAQKDDLSGAVEAAKRAIRIAPADPNTEALAGELALASGRADAAIVHFRRAVERAPAAHLRFHAGLFDASAAAGAPSRALQAYARAIELFTDERVLGSEARCLAPGDRYLLARMSRRAAYLLSQETADVARQAATTRAELLSRPDPRGICATGGRPGQTSPEAAVVSFWRAWSEGGRPAAERFLISGRRAPETSQVQPEAARPQNSPLVRVAWIQSLSGNPRKATVAYQLERIDSAEPERRCARTVTTFTPDGWFLDGPPVLDRNPCPL